MAKRIVFLCSGGGGNLKFIHYAIMNGLLTNAEIVSVITDRECSAGKYAIENGIEHKLIDLADENQNDLLENLSILDPDIVITNIHRILNGKLVDKFEGKMVNLHYSLLPAFQGEIGVSPIDAAIDYGAKFCGVTVHVVEKEVDAGKPLLQAVIPIKENEVPDQLHEIVFRCGCLSLLTVINDLITSGLVKGLGKGYVLSVKERQCMFSVTPDHMDVVDNDEIWKHARKAN